MSEPASGAPPLADVATHDPTASIEAEALPEVTEDIGVGTPPQVAGVGASSVADTPPADDEAFAPETAPPADMPRTGSEPDATGPLELASTADLPTTGPTSGAESAETGGAPIVGPPDPSGPLEPSSAADPDETPAAFPEPADVVDGPLAGPESYAGGQLDPSSSAEELPTTPTVDPEHPDVADALPEGPAADASGQFDLSSGYAETADVTPVAGPEIAAPTVTSEAGEAGLHVDGLDGPGAGTGGPLDPSTLELPSSGIDANPGMDAETESAVAVSGEHVAELPSAANPRGRASCGAGRGTVAGVAGARCILCGKPPAGGVSRCRRPLVMRQWTALVRKPAPVRPDCQRNSFPNRNVSANRTPVSTQLPSIHLPTVTLLPT